MREVMRESATTAGNGSQRGDMKEMLEIDSRTKMRLLNVFPVVFGGGEQGNSMNGCC